jgi:hypothetical protein
MSQQWLSVAQAAAALNVHPRTIERRMAGGKVEYRRADDGQVQVLVETADPAPSHNNEALETVKELADRQVDMAAGSASVLVRIAQEQAQRADNDLVFVRQDLQRTRLEMQMAWSVVAAMMLGLMIAVGWCTHSITLAHADAVQAADRAQQALAMAQTAQTQRDVSEQKLEEATIARARVEGQLTAYEQEQKKPTISD